MAFRTLAFFLREVYANFRKNPLMIVASVATVMLLVAISGAFLLAFFNLNALKQKFSTHLELVAYLKPGLSQEEILGVRSRLTGDPLVREVRFVSKEENLQNLKTSMRKKDLDLSGLTTNPLPDTFIIQVHDPADIPVLAATVKRFPQVDNVKSWEELLPRFLDLTRIFRVVGLLITGLLIFTTIFIINNTIRLSVFARRREIKIMELVGAAHWFIRGPFILEGMFYGLVGSLLAVLLLNTGYGSLVMKIAEQKTFFTLVAGSDLLTQLFLTLTAIGIAVGGIGSYLSVSKFLKL